MTKLAITYRALADLKEHPNNPRTHSKRQIEKIASAIARFGFTSPVLVDEDDCLLNGHGRVAAARLMNMAEVPTIRYPDMSAAEKRALRIADNRLAELSGWDTELIALEMHCISEEDPDLDPTLTGFELVEIDAMLSPTPAKKDKPDRLDKVPAQPAGPAITRVGDIWQIGEHRLCCGNALDSDVYPALMAGERATMTFSDPPYNVPINGHVSGLGRVQHQEFAMASGEMTTEEFKYFLFKALLNQADASTDGSIHYICIDWRHVEEMQHAGGIVFPELKNICVWAKTNGGMGSLYRSAHELIFVYKKGSAPHINNVELGKHGRYRTNVWHYPGANSFSASRNADLAMHPTVKPVALVADAMRDCSRRSDIVLDAFAGSGTTLVAAQKTKRRGYGVEIDPGYCDTIIRRMRDLFKIEAVLVGDGRPFDEVAAQRGSEDLEEVAA